MWVFEVIFVFRYGEDGLDGMWVENQSMPSMKPTNALFEKEFKLDLSDEKFVFLLLLDSQVFL